jgi:hypothetical protein
VLTFCGDEVTGLDVNNFASLSEGEQKNHFSPPIEPEAAQIKLQSHPEPAAHKAKSHFPSIGPRRGDLKKTEESFGK